MTDGSARLTSIVAVIILTASCLVFAAPGLQTESAQAVAVIEEAVAPEDEGEVAEQTAPEDEPEPVDETPAETVQVTDPAVEPEYHVIMVMGHGGLMIPVMGFTAPVADVPSEPEEVEVPVEPETVLTPVEPEPVEAPAEESVIGSKAPDMHHDDVPEVIKKIIDDLDMPAPVEEMRVEAPHHEPVLVYNTELLHQLLYELMLNPILDTDEIAVVEREISEHMEEVPDEFAFEPVEAEPEEVETPECPETPSQPVVFTTPCANATHDVLRAETVLAGLA